MSVVEVEGLSRTFGEVRALDDVTFSIDEHRITGLLGRNGAGKTTLLQLLSGQEFPTSGRISVLGAAPAENADVLAKLCFIKESQRYPEDFQVKHVLRTAAWFFEGWDQPYAEALMAEFEVPARRRVKKLSRGQRSALGIVLGLAARAPLTCFDEPCLGLDAVARQRFSDRLLADFAERPRTVVLSTHLIDEVADLLEHVLVLDRGRIVLDADVDDLRGSVHAVTGPAAAVDAFVRGRPVRSMRRLGGTATATVEALRPADLRTAAAQGLAVEPLSLQQLVVSAATATTGTEVHA